MSPSSSSCTTLAATLWPIENERASRIGRFLILAILGSAALGLSAKLQFSMEPVPITLQPLVLALMAGAYGWRLGLAALGLQVLTGLMGLPTLPGTLGPASLWSAESGFLAGAALAVFVIGYLAERGWDRRVVLSWAAMLLGFILLYGCGALGVASLLGWAAVKQELLGALHLSALLVQLGVAALVLPWIWRKVSARQSES